jgi:hypothetical protein
MASRVAPALRMSKTGRIAAMLLAGIVAATFMSAGCAILAADSPLGRSATYAIHKWRRRSRARRRALGDRQGL